LMDVHSGISTTSDSQNANFAACVNSCSFSFQGFEEFSKLGRATENHIMKHTGLVVHIGDVVGLLSEYVLRRFPPALVKLDDAEHRYDLLPGSSAFSTVLPASFSPPSAESTRADDILPASFSPPSAESTRAVDIVAPNRVLASASPLGVVAMGRAFPSGPSLGSPSVCYIAPPGLPHGSPACSMTARTGSPVRTPRTSSPSECFAAPPGLPDGSPAGGPAAWPVSPVCSAASPGLPLGSPAGAPADWSDSLDDPPVGLVPTARRSIFGPEPDVVDVWPRLPASFFEHRHYSVPSVALPPTPASVISVDFGGVGSSPGSPALSASSADSVASDDSSLRSRRRRRRRRMSSPHADARCPAESSSSSCASQGGGVHDLPPDRAWR
jgi:hypothetical protein